MTKPRKTQNKCIILTLIGAVAAFCLVSLHVKGKYTNQTMSQSSVQRNPCSNSWHEANIRGLQVSNKNKLIKVKSEPSPLYQMCNLALIQNQYAPPNVESRPYPNRYAPNART